MDVFFESTRDLTISSGSYMPVEPALFARSRGASLFAAGFDDGTSDDSLSGECFS